ncbi:hypothetical protein [Polyangium aurulentum]|uniref:hypothetical protein n=1 Tax=Polyangium aurulentum TaxID=2567896 RepID=UPI0010ADCF4F|nr:hypothetical protein [Polyangium aurulentum]UQA61010.1 hypothetical protein E8A73_011250 [Polyangium aurulentum]
MSFSAGDALGEFSGIGGNKGEGTSGDNSGTGAYGPVDVTDPTPPPSGGYPFADLCGGGCMSDDGALGCSLSGKDPDDEPGPRVSCQIVPESDGPTAVCMMAGSKQAEEVCVSASSCAPGLGCVAIGAGVSVCRPYCCNDPEACPSGTYCAPMPMAEDSASPEPMQIPVCIPPSNCTLLDDAACPDGLSCAIVRTNGTTSCVTPGEGELDEPCPCAAGYVCAKELNKCLQLCHAGSNSDCPAGMICQSGSGGVPPNFGICGGK